MKDIKEFINKGQLLSPVDAAIQELFNSDNTDNDDCPTEYDLRDWEYELRNMPNYNEGF